MLIRQRIQSHLGRWTSPRGPDSGGSANHDPAPAAANRQNRFARTHAVSDAPPPRLGHNSSQQVEERKKPLPTPHFERPRPPRLTVALPVNGEHIYHINAKPSDLLTETNSIDGTETQASFSPSEISKAPAQVTPEPPTPYPIERLGDFFLTNYWWTKAVVTSTEVYREGVHTFLILELALSEHRTWLKIERRANSDTTFISFALALGKAPANDKAQRGHDKEALIEDAVIINRQTFSAGLRPDVEELARIMEIIRRYSPDYHILTTNCRFICSLIQDHLHETYSGTFEIGVLMNDLLSQAELARLKPFMRRPRPRADALLTPAGRFRLTEPPPRTPIEVLLDSVLVERFDQLIVRIKASCEKVAREVALYRHQHNLASQELDLEVMIASIHAQIYKNIFEPFHPGVGETEARRWAGAAQSRLLTEPLAQVTEWRLNAFRMIDESIVSSDLAELLGTRLERITEALNPLLGDLPEGGWMSEGLRADFLTILENAYEWNRLAKKSQSNFEVLPAHQLPLVNNDGPKSPFEAFHLASAGTEVLYSTLGLRDVVEIDGKRFVKIQREGKLFRRLRAADPAAREQARRLSLPSTTSTNPSSLYLTSPARSSTSPQTSATSISSRSPNTPTWGRFSIANPWDRRRSSAQSTIYSPLSPILPSPILESVSDEPSTYCPPSEPKPSPPKKHGLYCRLKGWVLRRPTAHV